MISTRMFEEIFLPGIGIARPLIKPGIIILGVHYVWTDVLRVGGVGLVLASVFIFYGYVFDYGDPASAARKRAEVILTVYGFEKQTLDVVTELMETAFQPHQESIAGMVLHDAVYDFTGRVDFISMADRLYREEMAYGKAYDPKAWFRKTIQMVEQNPFLTETAKRLQSVPHEEQIRALKSFADEKLTGI